MSNPYGQVNDSEKLLASKDTDQKQTGCQKNKTLILIGGFLVAQLCTSVIFLATHNWSDYEAESFKLSAGCLNAENAEYMIDTPSEKDSWVEDV